jgi:hypothetical protein
MGTFVPARGRRCRRTLIVAVLMTLANAGSGGSGGGGAPPPNLPPVPEPPPWTWTSLGSPPAGKSPWISNQQPLVVSDDVLLLGTDSGIWRRLLDGASSWQRAGADTLTVHALALGADGTRVVAVGVDSENDTAATAWYSTDAGLSWTPAAEWPRVAAGNVDAGLAFMFFSLVADPDDPAVFYGGLSADSVAVSIDGGTTWILTDNATEPNFGYPCVNHRPRSVSVLLQGCELPLDHAWVGARDVIPDDRYTLPNPRRLYGGQLSQDELGNRRINAIAPLAQRSDRILVGVEGGLVELSTATGGWQGPEDTAVNWILKVPLDQQAAEYPYTYVRAIAPLDAAGTRLLFGGSVNGFNDVLSLYETFGNGSGLTRLDAPLPLHDPNVEQAWVIGADDLLLLVSESDPDHPDQELGPRRLTVFRLTR